MRREQVFRGTYWAGCIAPDACGSVPSSGDADGGSGDGAVGADGTRRDGGEVNAPVAAAANHAFVTAESFDLGAMGGVAGADARCQAAADAGDTRLRGRTYRTYRAWSSDSTAKAIARLEDANGWLRLDGRPLARAAADLIDLIRRSPCSAASTPPREGRSSRRSRAVE